MASSAAGGTESSTAHGSPVSKGEKIYRRILPGWFQPGVTKRIPQRAFMPRPWDSDDRPGDTDGLSVSRAAITPIEIAATRPDNGSKTHLAEFPASAAYDLGLTIEPKTTALHPGEAVIPQMNSRDNRDPIKAKQIGEWAITLRDIAVIVYEAPPESDRQQ